MTAVRLAGDYRYGVKIDVKETCEHQFLRGKDQQQSIT